MLTRRIAGIHNGLLTHLGDSTEARRLRLIAACDGDVDQSAAVERMLNAAGVRL